MNVPADRAARLLQHNALFARLAGGAGNNDDDEDDPNDVVNDASVSSPAAGNVLEARSPSPRNASILSEDSAKKCWICYASESDDEPGMEWISPCRCRGSMKWVHDKCLQMYIDSRIGMDTARTVLCPQCKTPYILVFPRMSRTLYVMDTFDRAITRTCPYLAAGMLVGSVYWAAVTYGAVTVMQVAGQEEGLLLMERADPMFLLVGLPTIPVFLIVGKMIPWEEKVLQGVRAVTQRAPALGYVLPGFRSDIRRRPRRQSMVEQSQVPPSVTNFGNPAPENRQENANNQVNNLNNPNNNNGDEHLIRTAFMATRVFCSALLFPAVASVVGKIFFPKAGTNWRRSLYGGLAFVAVKGAFKIYYLQNLYNIRMSRRVKNFDSTPPREIMTPLDAVIAANAVLPRDNRYSQRRATPAERREAGLDLPAHFFEGEEDDEEWETDEEGEYQENQYSSDENYHN